MNATAKITLLTSENPKRGKSAARFALHKNGQTIEQYVARCEKAGYPASTARADIRWDTSHKLIKVA